MRAQQMENSSGAAERHVQIQRLDLGLPRWKRPLDLAVAVILIIVLAPLLGLLAIAILVDSGRPIVFRQTRVGLGGQPFEILKFRSMHRSAPDDLHREVVTRWFAARKIEKSYARVDDPRVTRLGKVLRITATDELPQLINVLRGEMSVVGPRPAIPYELDLYEPWYFERLRVKPGMTGLWQISDRHQSSASEMMALDVGYVHNHSLRGDLSCILRTLPALLRHVRRRA